MKPLRACLRFSPRMSTHAAATGFDWREFDLLIRSQANFRRQKSAFKIKSGGDFLSPPLLILKARLAFIFSPVRLRRLF